MIIQKQLDYFNSQEDWVYLSKENKETNGKKVFCFKIHVYLGLNIMTEQLITVKCNRGTIKS